MNSIIIVNFKLSFNTFKINLSSDSLDTALKQKIIPAVKYHITMSLIYIGSQIAVLEKTKDIIKTYKAVINQTFIKTYPNKILITSKKDFLVFLFLNIHINTIKIQIIVAHSLVDKILKYFNKSFIIYASYFFTFEAVLDLIEYNEFTNSINSV